MPHKLLIITTILAIALVTGIMPPEAQGWNVSGVSHTPEIPKSGEAVKITIKFEDISNISSVYIIYCTIAPFKCEMPVNITYSQSNENTFTYTITKKYGPGTKIGFKFKVTYQNGTIQDIPKSESASYLHPVGGPYPNPEQGSFYFTYALQSEFPFYIIYIIISIIVVVVAIFAWRFKRKGKKHENEK